VPRKVRQLKRDLRKAGFTLEPGRGKGSHAVYSHPRAKGKVIISGNDGDDAPSWLEKHVSDRIKESKR
jgi:predicted RNA binding protein YcfA (HicA-like mRNA interferase family)